MKFRLWFQLVLILTTTALPSAGICLHMYREYHHAKGAYTNLMESLKPIRASQKNTEPYQRSGIVKQIWFRPLESSTSLYLQAEHSELLIETSTGRILAKERLHNVVGAFQDMPTFTTSFIQNPFVLRVLRATTAIFNYSSQLLEASEVSLEIFQLSKPLDLARHTPPPTERSTLSGTAAKIRLDCHSKPPHFKASRFRAYINPKAATRPKS